MCNNTCSAPQTRAHDKVANCKVSAAVPILRHFARLLGPYGEHNGTCERGGSAIGGSAIGGSAIGASAIGGYALGGSAIAASRSGLDCGFSKRGNHRSVLALLGTELHWRYVASVAVALRCIV